MTKRVSSAALPRLHLTNDDERALHKLRKDLHREVLGQYEEFLWRRNRTVDANRWKLLRSEGEIHAYREREFVPTSTCTRAVPQQYFAARSHIPRIMVVGKISGTLDDIMYANKYHDQISMHMVKAYQRDLMHDNSVLATIEGATEDDPYRFMGVTWYLRTYAFFSAIVGSRDLLAFEDLRLAKLSNGERIGVSICHSIEHCDLPELTHLNTTRMTASIVTVFRQLNANSVEVFMMDFLDTKLSAPEGFYLQEAAKTLLSIHRISDIAMTKKLCHRMRHKSRHSQEKRGLTRKRSFTLGDEQALVDTQKKHCEYCEKRVGGLFMPSARVCQLCDKTVCSRCTVKRDIILDVTGNDVVSRTFDFCVGCMLQTRATSTIEVARVEMRERQAVEELIRIRHEQLSTTSDSARSV